LIFTIALVQSFASVNVTACEVVEGGKVVCEFDSLEIENGIGTKCQELVGRYIESDFSFIYEAGAAELKFTHYAMCLSYLCTDEWIDNFVLTVNYVEVGNFTVEFVGWSCADWEYSWTG
jgi:hypothetical protein